MIEVEVERRNTGHDHGRWKIGGEGRMGTRTRMIMDGRRMGTKAAEGGETKTTNLDAPQRLKLTTNLFYLRYTTVMSPE
jgi:hypothetical protein